MSTNTWKCIPIKTACTNSNISALSLDDQPETWRDWGGSRTGLLRDRRGFPEILFFTTPTTFFTRTDFLLHEIVLSAVVPVSLKRFTAFNMFFFCFFITLHQWNLCPCFNTLFVYLYESWWRNRCIEMFYILHALMSHVQQVRVNIWCQ